LAFGACNLSALRHGESAEAKNFGAGNDRTKQRRQMKKKAAKAAFEYRDLLLLLFLAHRQICRVSLRKRGRLYPNAYNRVKHFSWYFLYWAIRITCRP
jgi:hypothetical protein